MPNAGTCGPHCGIRSNAEGTRTWSGHCDCGDPCHPAGDAPVVITREDLTAELRGTPMCSRWYERAGDYRPWDNHAVVLIAPRLYLIGDHDRRCDRDLCHPDCPVRRQAEMDDAAYPGRRL